VRAAAVQLEARVADIDFNLAACERLADCAGSGGAELIVLPEFFSTGIGFVPELIERALPPDGAATALLRDLARRHGAWVGGSFLCRDPDGDIRNAFLIAAPGGEIAGRHDKDLPTMWENSFYVGGEDDGVIEAAEGLTLGVGLCWELMRSQTVRRLRGRIDLAVGGSGWWSIPEGLGPAAITRRLEAANARAAWTAVEAFSGYVGAPFVHAAHAGLLECESPSLPTRYRGHFEGGTAIVDGDGTVLARRDWREGEGLAVAEVTPGRRGARAEPPDRFWLHKRGAMAAWAWNVERLHGRRWYRRHLSPAA
jgi:predicted amidohydrolase